MSARRTADGKHPCTERADGAQAEVRIWRDSNRAEMSLLAARYENQRFSAHANETFVIGTNARGHASCFDRSDRILGPGSLVVIPPGELHNGHRVGKTSWEYLGVYPSMKFLKRLLLETTGRDDVEPSFSRLFYSDVDLVSNFVNAHQLCLSDSDPLAGESAMIETLGVLLCRHGLSQGRRLPASRAPYGSRGKRAIARSMELMRDCVSEPLTLAALATAAGYSRFHYLRLFKAETGQTPHAYLMRYRVERAKSKLRLGEPIVDTAYATGFTDQAHFTRRFKELVGVTPGEFAKGSRGSGLSSGSNGG